MYVCVIVYEEIPRALQGEKMTVYPPHVFVYVYVYACLYVSMCVIVQEESP